MVGIASTLRMSVRLASTPPASLALPCAPDEIEQFLSKPDAATIQLVKGLKGPVAVLGAGGKMGLHLCLMLKQAAVAAGNDLRVIAVSRFTTLRDRESFTDAGIETISADLSVPAELAKLPEAPLVFFLAGVKFGTATSPELLEKMNVAMPRLVASRYRTSRIVAFSTGCVYPFVDVKSGGATESTPTAPVGDYALSCLKREEAFADAAREFKTPVALIRLNYSIEFRYGVLVDIAMKVLRREPIDVSMGHVNLIWQPDALNHVIHSAPLAASPAVPINITGTTILSVRELAAQAGRIVGIEPVLVGEEKPTAWLSDAGWSHKLFGAPPTSVETMQRWVAAWLTSGGETWGKPTGFETRDGKF